MLYEELMKLNKDELKGVAEIYGVKSAYKYKKAELRERIIEEMKLHLGETLAFIDAGHMEAFSTLACGEKGDSIYNPELFFVLKHMHFVIEEDMVHYHLAQEIQEAYKELEGNGDAQKKLKEEQKLFTKLRQYKRACINLYGIVHVDKLIKVCETYEGKLDIKLFSKWFAQDDLFYSGSYREGNWILDNSLREVSQEEYDYFLEQTRHKPYYEPTQEELLRYADECYYEETPAVQALRKYLGEKYPGHIQDSEEIILELITCQKIAILPDDQFLYKAMSVFSRFGYEMRSIAAFEALSKYVGNILEDTRMWIHNGHTTKEMTRKPKVLRKIGRNDRCPCGSRLKYKKCCGQ